MKKLLVIISPVIMLFFTACGGKKGNDMQALLAKDEQIKALAKQLGVNEKEFKEQLQDLNARMAKANEACSTFAGPALMGAMNQFNSDPLGATPQLIQMFNALKANEGGCQNSMDEMQLFAQSMGNGQFLNNPTGQAAYYNQLYNNFGASSGFFNMSSSQQMAMASSPAASFLQTNLSGLFPGLASGFSGGTGETANFGFNSGIRAAKPSEQPSQRGIAATSTASAAGTSVPENQLVNLSQIRIP